MLRLRVIDSHTEGEPTRVVVAGAPELPGRTVAERAAALAGPFDWLRRAIVCEPRGSDILVGALLLPPDHPGSAAGVVFFNNTGVLGMCGHGTMGLVRTLAHMANLQPGELAVDTPVGTVHARLRGPATTEAIEVRNVRSYVERLGARLELRDGRTVHGDIAWGGNWFFLCDDHGVEVSLDHLGALDAAARGVRQALDRLRERDPSLPPVDHVELAGKPRTPGGDGRAFVLCPGGAYDRSPCGTGTSAKLACLAARGELAPGTHWRQESVIGSVFEAWYQPSPEGGVMPTVAGCAWITAEAELIVDPTDPFRHGVHACHP